MLEGRRVSSPSFAAKDERSRSRSYSESESESEVSSIIDLKVSYLAGNFLYSHVVFRVNVQRIT